MKAKLILAVLIVVSVPRSSAPLSPFTITGATGSTKLTARMEYALQRASAEEEVHAWLYFTDKGSRERIGNVNPLTLVSERSLQRRRKAFKTDLRVDYHDVPLEESYVQGLMGLGIRVRQRSKWFNGVSVIAGKSLIMQVEALPFVRQIDLLARFKRNQSEGEEADQSSPMAGPSGEDRIHSLDYGASFGQVNQINVPVVHDLGNHAEGVIVGVFDNGFRLLTHESFASMNIIATYDFVDHKVSVVPNNPSTSFGAHGVNTLSTIGGYKPGQLIGPAFGASFILARTENDSSETPVEEDNWVAAIEWADSIGVDVTSTSLGYLTYDAPYTSWTWEDMNGNTTVITRAADMAVARGIVVVNSAGNEGFNPSHNTLIAPADGDSVLTVGAVTSSGTRSSFSSVGPTTSIPPRIKPDVMAQGSSVRVASATNTTSYGSASGTSFSCPLAAGVAALILNARPTATPLEVMNSMRTTASNASSPNNLIGWGILDALAAINGIPLPIQLYYFTATYVPGYDLVRLDWGTLTELNNYGFEVQKSPNSLEGFQTLPNSFVPGNGTTTIPHKYSFSDSAPSMGTWYYRIKQTDLDGTIHYTEAIRAEIVTHVHGENPIAFALEQNYPNPFNPNTKISFQISDYGFVRLKVFDALGREVATLVNETLPLGKYDRVFDGANLPSGMYLYRLQVGSHSQTRKLLLLK